MSTPKSHHYVPKMILRNFADERGQLYFYRKDRASAGVKSASIDRLFASEHLYSKKKADGSKDPEFERTLASLEAEASTIFKHVITMVRSGKAPNLDHDRKETVALFIYVQWKRSYDHRSTFLSDQVFNDLLIQSTSKATKRFPERLDEIDNIRSQLGSKENIHNVRIDVLRTINPDTLDLMTSRTLAIAIPTKTNKSWIIGSSPVAKLGNSDLTHPESEIWLPLAPDIAIGLCGTGEREKLLRVPDMAVRQMNTVIACQSGMFGGRSEALIRSLTGIL